MDRALPTLVTIPYSHFCEKARWALKHHGVAFREEGHPPLVCRARLLTRGVWHSVPVLFDDDRVIPDSTAILRHLDARAEPARRWLKERVWLRLAVFANPHC